MLVTSIVNPSLRSEVGCHVFHYKGESILISGVGMKYSELRQIVAREWNLTDNVVFETKDLDVCCGRLVQIHETAWADICGLVGNVSVREKHSPRDTETASTCTNTPSKKVDNLEVKTPGPVNTVARKEYDAQLPTPRVLSDDQQMNPTDITHDYIAATSLKQYTPAEELEEPGMPKESLIFQNFVAKRLLANDEFTGSRDFSSKTENIDLWRPFETFHSRDISRSHQTDTPNPVDASLNNEMILIYINAPGRNGTFRAKKDYSIATVLRGICKNFKLDFKKSVLLLHASEDDDTATDLIECDNHATLYMLGVESGQHFTVRVNGQETGKSQAESD